MPLLSAVFTWLFSTRACWQPDAGLLQLMPELKEAIRSYALLRKKFLSSMVDARKTVKHVADSGVVVLELTRDAGLIGGALQQHVLTPGGGESGEEEPARRDASRAHVLLEERDSVRVRQLDGRAAGEPRREGPHLIPREEP